MKKFILLTILSLVATFALGNDRPNDKAKEKKTVDSGSFGIFLNGKRIGTEKFTIEQQGGDGIIVSDIDVEDGPNKSEQSSEMRVGSDGNLKVYKWHSTVPTREESIVEPKDELLIEHVTTAEQKKRDVPYVVPLSTIILDDDFFSQRELLIWRYMITGCELVPKPVPGQPMPPDTHYQCGPAQFGILIPHQHTPGTAAVQPLGLDKVNIKGAERELNKFKLDTDGVQWLIWVEDNYKVIKMSIPSSNVEVVRD